MDKPLAEAIARMSAAIEEQNESAATGARYGTPSHYSVPYVLNAIADVVAELARVVDDVRQRTK